MSIGLLGKKIGMTRIYDEDGAMIPVTVIDVSGNTVLQKKTTETDGYNAVQVGYDTQKEKRVTKARSGHFKKHNSEAKRYVKEFRFDADLPDDIEELSASLFEDGQFVDIIGTTKGKGFQGVYRRYNFGGLPAAHGSMMHRRPGSIGAGSTPGRVWKNTKMPGRMGGRKVTVQNLKVVQSRPEDNVLLISGAVPGSKGGYVIIRPAIKKQSSAK
ncbi:MAG: 50S ribosomal protein L3 [Verrucomicrobiales bacterium]|nr:50S ribosomal protein L3 [Verrucomicrobiales bacterium]